MVSLMTWINSPSALGWPTKILMLPLQHNANPAPLWRIVYGSLEPLMWKCTSPLKDARIFQCKMSLN